MEGSEVTSTKTIVRNITPEAVGVDPKTDSWTSGGEAVTVEVHKGRDETDEEWCAEFDAVRAAALVAWPKDA